MMKTFSSLILASMLVFTLTVAASAQNAAMVVDLKGGGVEYLNGDRNGKPVQLMDFLINGESLKLNSETLLVLNFFESGSREKFTGPGRVTIGKTGGTVSDGAKVSKSEIGKVLRQAVGNTGHHFGTVSLRTVAGPSDGIILHNLNRTATKLQDLILAWLSVPKAEKYQVLVKSSISGKILEKETPANKIELPEKLIRSGESYTWQVSAIKAGKVIAQGEGKFNVLSREEQAAVLAVEKYIKKSMDFGSNESLIAFSQLYRKYEMNDDARDVLKKLQQTHPGNENIKEQLAMLSANYGQ